MPTNALIHETSPYLLQHAHNPVDWFPWKEEVLEKAQKEDKLLIISIGYAACHWCHVMEHESFEDEEVSQIMNEHFVSIKVDREERPDVDDVYMTACQISSDRSCGWPLNAFALPDGRPVWAGTYFPKKNWIEILQYFQDLYQTDKEKLIQYAEQLTENIQKIDQTIAPPTQATNYSPNILLEAASNFQPTFDAKWGGQTGAPKFPMPNQYEFLLSQYYFQKNPAYLEMVTTTLDQMAMGGIYDHLGGGFARYSTDNEWFVPHFEKMLYDNAQLVSLYAHAYQITKKPNYKMVMDQTLAYIEREMLDASGGFYSSLDADSEGEEGKYYVWTKKAIDSLLGGQELVELFSDYYEVQPDGNWEDKNILHVRQSLDQLAIKYKLSLEKTKEKLALGRQILLEAREKRIRPGLDDKILTSWNALMLMGFIDAYRATGHQKYLDIALQNGQFLKREILDPKTYTLSRNFKNGKSTIHGFLDDYAHTIMAFVKLYEVTFDENWLAESQKLSKTVINEFYDEESGLFFYKANRDAPLIARKKGISDNVIPSANSMMVRALYQLGIYLDHPEFIQKSERALQVAIHAIDDPEKAFYFTNWLLLYNQFVYPTQEVAIIGPAYASIQQELLQSFVPNAFFLGGKTEGSLALLKNKLVEGETYIYVCENKVCQLPVKESRKALKQIQESL